MITPSFVAGDGGGPIQFRSSEFMWGRDRPRSVPVHAHSRHHGSDLAVTWAVEEGPRTRVALATWLGQQWTELRVDPEWRGYTAPACRLLLGGRTALAWGGPVAGAACVLDRSGRVMEDHSLGLRPERLTITAGEAGLRIGGARSTPRHRPWNPITQPHGSAVRVQAVSGAVCWAEGDLTRSDDFAVDETHEHTPAVVVGSDVVFGVVGEDGNATLFAVRDGRRSIVVDDIEPGAGEWFDATSDGDRLVVCYRDGATLVTLASMGEDWERVGAIDGVRRSMGHRIAARDGTVHVCWWQFGRTEPGVFVAACSGGTVGEPRAMGPGGGAAITWCGDRLIVAWVRELERTGGSSRHDLEIVEIDH